MKLNNSALQELYDTIINGTFTCLPYEERPIDKAFKECDEKLSDSIAFVHVKDLQDRNDVLMKSEATLLEANVELASQKRQLEKDLDDAKKQLNYFTHSRDDWRDRAKHAEEELHTTEKVRDNIRAELEAKVKRMDEITKERDSYRDLYTELSKAYDKLSGENRGLNARIDCLRLEVNWYRKHFKEQSDKILGLKSRLNSMCGDEYLNKLLDSTRNDSYEQGQKDLWDKLQEVSDYYYFGGDDEFDTDDCEMTSMTDIIDILNVDQFLEAYKNWHKAQEQERTKYMRDYLERFCRGRLCSRCPLGSDEYKCRCAYSFNGAHPIPDEDIKRYYEKVRACSKPLSHWECTLEGTINVEFNKDLLNKVCGIDSDD